MMDAKQKAELLDKFLQAVIKEKEEKGGIQLAKVIGRDIDINDDISTYFASELESSGLASITKQPLGGGRNDLRIILNDNAKFFLLNGGYSKLYKQKATKEKEERELKKLQLTEIKARLANMESQIKKQSDFWTTSTARNKSHMNYMKAALVISIISLLLTALNIFDYI